MVNENFKEKALAIVSTLKVMTRKIKGQTLYGIVLKQRHLADTIITNLVESECVAWEFAYNYLTTPPFSVADKVVMNDCAEATLSKYQGKVWTCRSNAFLSSSFEWVVFLDGYLGYFLCSCLKKSKS